MSVASTPVPAAPAPRARGVSTDERVGGVRLIVRLLQRPELGALLGAVAVYLLFASVDSTPGHKFSSIAGMQNWTDAASTYGIMAVAAAIGALNGFLVIRTKLPSFIITLATFFVLRGMNVGVTLLLTNTVRFDITDKAPGFSSAQAIFGSTFLAPYNFQTAVLWWIAITIVATWVLTRTTFGNWIYAVGGDSNAARNVGVPVARTKVILFMGTAMSAALVGIMVALRYKGIQSGQGIGQEFFYIIAAVVGGCLLTGGYGSAIGASIGALIIGFAQIGIIFANWDSNWYFTFLGVILFLAVGVNTRVRRRAASARR